MVVAMVYTISDLGTTWKKSIRFRLIRRLRRTMGHSSISVSGEYGRIVGSAYDQSILLNYAETKTWCSVENRFFVDFFARHGRGTYLDIGANIGLTTIPVARNPAVACLAFEPEPRNFHYLKRNIRTNCPRGNVRLFQLALSDRCGKSKLALSPTNKGDHRLVMGRCASTLRGAISSVSVDVARLDDIVQGFDLPLAAKLVAQGSEVHILAGGHNTLARAEALVFEFCPYLLAAAQPDWRFLYDFLRHHFVDAALIPGGCRTELSWRPMAILVEDMQTLMRNSMAMPEAYFHIFVRKGRPDPHLRQRQP
jgi:FkbM family methyltransferase